MLKLVWATLNAEDPQAGKSMLLVVYLLQCILLPLSSCGQLFVYDGFVEVKKKTARSAIHFISDAIFNSKLGRHLIRTFNFIRWLTGQSMPIFQKGCSWWGIFLERQKISKILELFLLPHKEKISPKSRCTRKEMVELQLPREALCSALTSLCSGHLTRKKAEKKTLSTFSTLCTQYMHVFYIFVLFFPFLENNLFRLVFHLERRSDQFLSRGVSRLL